MFSVGSRTLAAVVGCGPNWRLTPALTAAELWRDPGHRQRFGKRANRSAGLVTEFDPYLVAARHRERTFDGQDQVLTLPFDGPALLDQHRQNIFQDEPHGVQVAGRLNLYHALPHAIQGQ